MPRFSGFRLLIVLTLALVTGWLAVSPGAQASSSQTYIVLYREGAATSGAAAAVQKAGGTLVASYSQIGVVIARASSLSFRDKLISDSKVEGVSATGAFGVRLKDEVADDFLVGPPAIPATDSDNLSGLQWDMVQIHAPEAHAISGGDPSVVVGDIDTGLDYQHPDLAPNVDFANSASCVSGAPDTNPAAWDDDNGHGTHTAGTIAAASNGIGMVGVAPNVKIAGIKAGNTDGFFFPEAVVCSFMWAGSHGIDVTNNSYFADPWLFNCRNDAEQHAIWKAEQRAIRWAMGQGVVVVAAQGNENIDLSKQNVDTISPDNVPEPLTREVTNACVVIPNEIAGVVSVTANGNLLQKSYYSSYGVGVADVVAPGGDRRFQMTAAAPNGRVLSTYPAELTGGVPGSLVVHDGAAAYVYLQGTSMASPHAAGVAALIRSRHPDMSPGVVAAMLGNTADPQPCPQNPYNPGPPFIFEAWCAGGNGYNGFFGHGQVNALAAVQ